tara:strand:+ start:4286 stop:5161 length:876 start_codon:yes stop_codon:yes gene_type:complete
MPIVHKYKRTVRCGYCHQPGHNRSSCPLHAARIEELRELYGDDYFAVAVYDQKKNRRKASAKTRSCSYCGEKGHNRKTCAALKSDVLKVKAKNAAYRQGVYEAMVKHGIFTGAVVESENHTRLSVVTVGEGTSRYRMPMVITRVKWEHINIWETEFRYYSSENMGERAPLHAKPINDLFQKYAQNIGFPQDYNLVWNKMTLDVFEKYMGPDDDWYGRFKHNYFPTVVSPVSAEKPPLGWLTCDDTESQQTLKEFFKKRTSKDIYHSYTKGCTRDEEAALARARAEAAEKCL